MRSFPRLFALALCLAWGAHAHTDFVLTLPPAERVLTVAELSFLQQIPGPLALRISSLPPERGTMPDCQSSLIQAVQNQGYARRVFPLGAITLESSAKRLLGSLVAFPTQPQTGQGSEVAVLVAGKVVGVHARTLEHGNHFEITLLHQWRTGSCSLDQEVIVSTFDAGDLSEVVFLETPEKLSKTVHLTSDDLQALELPAVPPRWGLLPPVAFHDEPQAARIILEGALVRSVDAAWGGRVVRARARGFGLYQLIVQTPEGLRSELANAQELRIYLKESPLVPPRFHQREFAFFQRVHMLRTSFPDLLQKNNVVTALEKHLKELGRFEPFFPELFYQDLQVLWQGAKSLPNNTFSVEEVAKTLSILLTRLARPHIVGRLIFGSVGNLVIVGKVRGFQVQVPLTSLTQIDASPIYDMFIETPEGIGRISGFYTETALKVFAPYRFGLP